MPGEEVHPFLRWSIAEDHLGVRHVVHSHDLEIEADFSQLCLEELGNGLDQRISGRIRNRERSPSFDPGFIEQRPGAGEIS